MRLQQLQLLLTINVTQPALTKTLKQLEEEFGATLVLRSPKGVRLSPAGEMLAVRAASVLREIERAKEEMAALTHNTQVTLTVGLSPAAALVLAANTVSAFQSRWPEVRVRLVDALYPKALHQLRSGELDLALGPLPPTGMGGDLHTRALLDSPSVIVVKRGHPLEKARSLEELEGSPWLLTGPRLGPGDPIYLGFEERGMVPARVTLECESLATLLAVLPNMNLLSIVPLRFYDAHGPRMGLVALDLQEHLPTTTIHMFTRSEVPLSLPAQRLLDAFVQQAAEVRKLGS
jgi:LysR family transcriptional regulator, regulator of abg operon